MVTESLCIVVTIMFRQYQFLILQALLYAFYGSTTWPKRRIGVSTS